MRRRKNPALTEAEALVREESSLGLLWEATPEGIVGPDYVHLLVAGRRDYHAPVEGGVFLYAPNLDQAVLVEPEGREALVTIGSLNAAEFLKRRKGGLSAALDLAVNAYSDEGPGVVSEKLVSQVRQAANLALEASGISPSWQGLLPRDADVVWRELGKRWVAQPWGIGTQTELLGGWA